MKIVFFGDSITAADRDRSDPSDLGSGYVGILYEKLKNLYESTDFEFLNRGIGGDRVRDLEARVDADVVAERPDIAVVLVGINDVWRKYDSGAEFDLEQFSGSYENVLKKIKDCGAKLIAVEPFLFNVPDKKRFRREFDPMLAAIREIASRYADAFVPLDEMFAGVSQNAGIAAYSADGIHPTHRAARLIADNVIKKIRMFL